jgi:hypothetical protein
VEIAAPAPDPTGSFGVGPANYQRLPLLYASKVLQAPGVIQVTLPPYDQLLLWDLDPEEEGTGDFPPRVDDRAVAARIVTWIRLRYASPVSPVAAAGEAGSTSGLLTATTRAEQPQARLAWVGLNAAPVVQAVPVVAEPLGVGTGTPYQTFMVANTPVIVGQPGAELLVEVQQTDGTWTAWQQTDDLYSASATDTVYLLDPASGAVTCGSGLHGARFPLGHPVRVSYLYGGGLQGKVPIGAISRSPKLPGGFSVANPVATWGADPGETVADGERNISRWLRHRDRLVTAADFKDVTRRTPGVDLGRVEVLPLFNPAAFDASQADRQWPGMVTLMVIPRSDPDHPDAPRPDRQFLDAVCAWLDPRRLITTDVKTYLSPLTGGVAGRGTDDLTCAAGSSSPAGGPGWPLATAVRSHDIEAVATRVAGVRYVDSVLLAWLPPGGPLMTGVDQVPLAGLQLPDATVFVALGPAEDPASLIGSSQPVPPTQVPVPIVPPTC